MNPENTDAETIKGVYGIFERICQPRRPGKIEIDYPLEETADEVRQKYKRGVELRVTSKFAPSPKLLFISDDSGNLDVHFLPNLYEFEIPKYPLAYEVRKEFHKSVKSYLRKLSKKTGNGVSNL